MAKITVRVLNSGQNLKLNGYNHISFNCRLIVEVFAYFYYQISGQVVHLHVWMLIFVSHALKKQVSAIDMA